jgi:hypothetical protein
MFSELLINSVQPSSTSHALSIPREESTPDDTESSVSQATLTITNLPKDMLQLIFKDVDNKG